MGTDIRGFIECRAWPQWSGPRAVPWRAAIELYPLYDTRDYDSFGCLFGVTNFAGFRPIAPDRGLPDDAADRTREARDGYDPIISTTWITWAEIDAIDLDEPAERPDARVHEYAIGADGELTFKGKAAWSQEFAALAGLDPIDYDYGTAWQKQSLYETSWPEGTEWRTPETVYRVERLRRRDVLGSHWTPVWTVMRTLADLHGPDNVRLIAWFDR